MIPLGDTLYNRVEDLLDVLSQDIQHIEQSLVYLDSLRSMLIKRDEPGLNALLHRIRTETDTQTGLEIERQRIRQELAQLLNLDFAALTLSRLASLLPEALGQRVSYKRKRLRKLVEQLSQEHLSTAWLLKDFQRFNQALFHAIFNNGRNTTLTYGANGLKQRHAHHNLMNMQF
jgi:hypothetical protein